MDPNKRRVQSGLMWVIGGFVFLFVVYPLGLIVILEPWGNLDAFILAILVSPVVALIAIVRGLLLIASGPRTS